MTASTANPNITRLHAPSEEGALLTKRDLAEFEARITATLERAGADIVRSLILTQIAIGVVVRGARSHCVIAAS
jgi:hypothetical protein